MNNSGLNMEIVKDHNRALIIQLICTNNGVTRQDLTEATNLTPMTLTNITSELIKNNLICEIDGIKDVEPQHYPFIMKCIPRDGKQVINDNIKDILKNSDKVSDREIEVPKVVG